MRHSQYPSRRTYVLHEESRRVMAFDSFDFVVVRTGVVTLALLLDTVVHNDRE